MLQPDVALRVEKMVNEIVSYLKRRKLWETDCGIIYNGKHLTHKGVEPRQERLRGVARFWFEGTLYRMIYHGIGDPKHTTYKRITEIMNKHGFYPEFGSATELNVYIL